MRYSCREPENPISIRETIPFFTSVLKSVKSKRILHVKLMKRLRSGLSIGIFCLLSLTNHPISVVLILFTKKKRYMWMMLSLALINSQILATDSALMITKCKITGIGLISQKPNSRI